MDDLTRQLRQKYSPEGSVLRHDQMELLQMLKFFDTICKQHQIEWWLSSGTLLGAVRHQGFIPWDDDMDIVMMKKDYKRLVDIMRKYDSDDYVLQSIETDCNYVCAFAKFRKKKGCVSSHNPHAQFYKWKGIGFDVFVLQESTYLTAQLSSFIYSKAMNLTLYCNNEKIRCCLTRIMQFFLFKFTFPIIRILFNVGRKTGELHYAQGTGWARHTFYLSDIYPLRSMSFEDTEFKVPSRYDAYLRNVFGDYLQIPSEEEIKQTIHCKEYLYEIYGEN